MNDKPFGFIDKSQFVDPMIPQYQETIRSLREAKKRRAQVVLDEFTQQEEKDDFFMLRFRYHLRADKEHSLLSEMLNDNLRAFRTVKAYYSLGGKWDEEYCVLSYITGSTRNIGHSSVVERLVERGERVMERQKQCRLHRRLEEAIEAVHSRRVDTKTEEGVNDALIRRYDVIRNRARDEDNS